MSAKGLERALRVAKERKGYADGMSVWDPTTWFDSSETPTDPNAKLLLQQVEAEKRGEPLPGSVAYEMKQKEAQQFLPSPSSKDVIEPSESQGPNTTAENWASWVASHVVDPNLDPSKKAEAERRISGAFQLVPEMLGLSSAYRAGKAGGEGRYGEAAFEGANAALGVLPFALPAVDAIRGVRAASKSVVPVEDTVDLARRSLFSPRPSAEGAVVAPQSPADDLVDKILGTQINRRQANQGIVTATVAPKFLTGAEKVAEPVVEAVNAAPLGYDDLMNQLKEAHIKRVYSVDVAKPINREYYFRNKELEDKLQLYDTTTGRSNHGFNNDNYYFDSETGYYKPTPSQENFLKNYADADYLKLHDEVIEGNSRFARLYNEYNDLERKLQSEFSKDPELLERFKDDLEKIYAGEYGKIPDASSNLNTQKNVPQIEAPKEAPQIEAPKEAPTLSIPEQRQSIQDNIKGLRSSLNALQKGSPEYDQILKQITDEGTKLGQLRGPSGPSVPQIEASKELPPVEIKSYSPTGLYSRAEEVARRLKQPDTPENVIKAIKNASGVKDAELIDSRVITESGAPHPDFVEYVSSGPTGRATPSAVGDYIAENSPNLRKYSIPEGESHYGDYTELREHPEGATNYRELLFYNDENDRYPQYSGGHWGDVKPGTSMHSRVTDTPDSLFVHEMQSDQAQQGRKYGFGDVRNDPELVQLRINAKQALDYNTKLISDLEAELKNAISTGFNKDTGYYTPEAEKIIDDLDQRLTQAKWDDRRYNAIYITAERNERFGSASTVVPPSPHVQETGAWTRAMAKELLVEAVESGKNKIEITGANVQNMRSNRIDVLPEDYVDHTQYYNNVVPSEFKNVLKAIDPEADVSELVKLRKVQPSMIELEFDPGLIAIENEMESSYEVIRNLEIGLKRLKQGLNAVDGSPYYPNANQLSLDESIQLYEDNIEEMEATAQLYAERLYEMKGPRDRIEINLTPKMVEAIKGKKLTKYFQGGRVE